MLNGTIQFKSILDISFIVGCLILAISHQPFSQNAFNAENMLKNHTHNAVPPFVDSLILSLNYKMDDQQRLETLYSICDNTVSGDANLCIAYGQECLRLAEKLGDLQKQHSITLWMGISYDDKGEYSKAIELYQISLNILEALEKSTDEQNISFYSKKAILFNNIGYVYFNIGMYEDAQNYYLEGLEIADKHTPESKATILGSMCELYFAIGDLDKAQEYANASLLIADDTFDLTLACRMLGDIFESRSQPDSSIYYYNRAFEYAKCQQDNYLLGIGVEGLFNYYLARKNYDQVVQTAKYALVVAEALDGKAQMITANLALAKAYFQLGEEELSFEYAQKALALCLSTGTITFLPNCYEVMESIYLEKNDFQNAYSFRKKLQAAKEDIFNSEKMRFLVEAESLQKLRMKENENQLLKATQAKNEAMLRQRTAFIAACLLALFLAMTVLFFMYKSNEARKRYNKHLEKEVEKRTADLTRSNIELERFNHIISHDLKEPLRNIVSFSSLSLRKTKKIDDPELNEYLNFIKNSAFQLNMLVEDVREFTSIGRRTPERKPVDLNVLLNNVIETLTINIKQKNASITLPKELPIVESHPSLLFILYKNIIENGLKYNRSEKPHITVSFNENADNFIFTIKDNGIGIPPENKGEVFEMFKRLHSKSEFNGTGMGLSICKKIADRLGGHIEIVESSDAGTSFQVNIPKAKELV